MCNILTLCSLIFFFSVVKVFSHEEVPQNLCLCKTVCCVSAFAHLCICSSFFANLPPQQRQPAHIELKKQIHLHANTTAVQFFFCVKLAPICVITWRGGRNEYLLADQWLGDRLRLGCFRHKDDLWALYATFLLNYSQPDNNEMTWESGLIVQSLPWG